MRRRGAVLMSLRGEIRSLATSEHPDVYLRP